MELIKLRLYRLCGKSYLEWYANRLDGFAEGESAVASGMVDTHRYFLSGDEDLEVLIELGMEPRHTLFELGCGFGRSAQHFVRYLDSGTYVGSDISKERLRQCQEFLEHRDLLENKRPELIVNRDNTFDWVSGRKFNFVWSGNVFTHVPPEDLETIMKNVKKVIDHNSTFVFTYTENAEKSLRRHHAKDWDRNFDFFQDLATRHGFVAENVSDLMRGRGGHGPREKLVRCTLLEASGK